MVKLAISLLVVSGKQRRFRDGLNDVLFFVMRAEAGSCVVRYLLIDVDFYSFQRIWLCYVFQSKQR